MGWNLSAFSFGLLYISCVIFIFIFICGSAKSFWYSIYFFIIVFYMYFHQWLSFVYLCIYFPSCFLFCFVHRESCNRIFIKTNNDFSVFIRFSFSLVSFHFVYFFGLALDNNIMYDVCALFVTYKIITLTSIDTFLC